MREIKFRAWDKASGEMFTPQAISNIGSPIIWQRIGKEGSNYPECPLMQFTGLKDKNGKEIYEGDIIAPWEGTKTNNVVVIQPNGIGVRDSMGIWQGQLHFRTFEVEVIGNIYNNPELLK